MIQVPNSHVVKCPIHGEVVLSHEEYQRQLKAKVLETFKTLICPIGREPGFDLTRPPDKLYIKKGK